MIMLQLITDFLISIRYVENYRRFVHHTVFFVCVASDLQCCSLGCGLRKSTRNLIIFKKRRKATDIRRTDRQNIVVVDTFNP
jgi:hypothetical protein